MHKADVAVSPLRQALAVQCRLTEVRVGSTAWQIPTCRGFPGDALLTNAHRVAARCFHTQESNECLDRSSEHR